MGNDAGRNQVLQQVLRIDISNDRPRPNWCSVLKYYPDGSATLNDIAGLYSAPDEPSFAAKAGKLSDKFAWLERRPGLGPYFDGGRFSLVDAVFGPVFRYFDVFDRIADFGILEGKSKVAAWRATLAARSSIRAAVAPDYDARLWAFLPARNSHLSQLMAKV